PSCTGCSRVPYSNRDGRWEGDSPRENCQCIPSSCTRLCTRDVRITSCSQDENALTVQGSHARRQPDLRRLDQGLRRPTKTIRRREGAATQNPRRENSRCPPFRER